MAKGTLTIPRSVYRHMVEHCLLEKPLEACGILGGRAGVVTRGYAMTNKLRSPVRYEMDPEEQLKVMREIWGTREELVAIYHSHPKTRAWPSETDIKLAFYPEAFYLIVSLSGEAPVVGAFRILDSQVHLAKLTISDDPGGPWTDLSAPS